MVRMFPTPTKVGKLLKELDSLKAIKVKSFTLFFFTGQRSSYMTLGPPNGLVQCEKIEVLAEWMASGELRHTAWKKE